MSKASYLWVAVVCIVGMLCGSLIQSEAGGAPNVLGTERSGVTDIVFNFKIGSYTQNVTIDYYSLENVINSVTVSLPNDYFSLPASANPSFKWKFPFTNVINYGLVYEPIFVNNITNAIPAVVHAPNNAVQFLDPSSLGYFDGNFANNVPMEGILLVYGPGFPSIGIVFWGSRTLPFGPIYDTFYTQIVPFISMGQFGPYVSPP